MEKTNPNWSGAGFVAAAFIASGLAYAHLPERAPAGWDAILFPTDLLDVPPRVSRSALALLLPSIALGVLLVLQAFKTRGGEKFTRWLFGSRMGGADAEEFSVYRFEKTYDLITTLLVGIIVLIHFMSLALGFSAGRPIGRIFVFLLGGLFAAIGNFIPRIRPNPVMGIRTAKTLSDRGMWTRAHRLFGRMVFGTGVLVMLLALTEFEFALITAFAGLLISLVVVAVYVHARRPGAVGALLLLIAAAPAHGQSLKPDGLGHDVDRFIERVMALDAVPALAIALVKDSNVILTKGYGYGDLERAIAATPNTAFYLGSITKSFTALTAAIMSERGLVDLDAPIREYMPDLELMPPLSPDSITLRMLLSHTHGISNEGPVVWRTAYSGEHSRAELPTMMREQKPSGSGRTYRYTNIGYNLAGMVLESASGRDWKTLMHELVFEPLEMRNTSAFVSRLDSSQLAMPYVTEDHGFRRVHYSKADGNMHAAGGNVSTASDLARWLLIQLNDGRIAGRQLVSASVIRETQRQQVAISGSANKDLTGYGLGWMLGKYGSEDILVHTGGFSSFSTMIALVPRLRIGVAVAVNESTTGNTAQQLVVQYVLERAAAGADSPQSSQEWLDRLAQRVTQRRANVVHNREQRMARADSAYDISALAGTYEHDSYGRIVVAASSEGVVVQAGVLRSAAEVFDAAAHKLRVELVPGEGEILSFDVVEKKPRALEFRGVRFGFLGTVSQH